MLKLRFKRTGKKRSPSYRLVIIENSSRRNGRPVDEVGYYSPVTKKYELKTKKIKNWLKCGVKPTSTVSILLKKAGII